MEVVLRVALEVLLAVLVVVADVTSDVPVREVNVATASRVLQASRRGPG